MTSVTLYCAKKADSVRNLIFYLWHTEAAFYLGHDTSRNQQVKSEIIKHVCSRHLVISLYVLINDETSWKQHLMLESCRFELSVTGLLCWSGLGLESDFSNSCNDLDSFQGYFYSDLCCSWLPLEAFMSYLCTVLLKKTTSKDSFPYSFIAPKTLILKVCCRCMKS